MFWQQKGTMKSNSALFALLGAGILFNISEVRADLAINFENGNELTTIFSHNTPNISWVPSGGVGNSGALLVSSNINAEATYRSTSFDFSHPGTALSCSIFFKYRNPTQDSYPIQLGFLSSPNTVFDANANAMGVTIDSELGGVTDIFADFGQRGSGFILNPLTPGNWYRLSGTMVNQTSTLQITVSLDDFGTTGTTFAHNITTFTETQAPDGFIASDSTVWLAFEANAAGGATMVDNLTAAPEPSVTGLTLLATGLWTLRRARTARGCSAR